MIAGTPLRPAVAGVTFRFLNQTQFARIAVRAAAQRRAMKR